MSTGRVLYVLDMGGRAQIRAFKPPVDGVAEVLHAYFPAHAYPMHTHDAWAVMVIDDGVVRYDLEHHEHGALTGLVTVLPPFVPHDGRSVTASGFRKRVLYLDAGVLGEDLIGRAVDHPEVTDPVLRRQVDGLHQALDVGHQELEVTSRLAVVRRLVRDRLRDVAVEDVSPEPGLARRLRSLLDDRVTEPVTITELARELQTSDAYLVRSFTAHFGIPPHRYLTGRRIDAARRLLLAGHRPAYVAGAVGLHDQSHLNRHFLAMLGVTPAAYQRGQRGLAPGG